MAAAHVKFFGSGTYQFLYVGEIVIPLGSIRYIDLAPRRKDGTNKVIIECVGVTHRFLDARADAIREYFKSL